MKASLFPVFFALLLVARPGAGQLTNTGPRAMIPTRLSAPAPVQAQYMAAHMLACAAEKTDPAAIATRTWAFVLLRLPHHAIASLKSGLDTLPRAELPFLQGEAARLQTEQKDELTDFLAGYLPLVESSNTLYAAHLDNLRSVAGGGIVLTNEVAEGQPDARKLASGTCPAMVVLRLSRQWLDAACARVAYANLAEQLRVVAELRRHPLWDLVVIIAPANSDAPLTAEVFAGDGPESRTSATIQAKPALLGGLGRDESQTALEEFVIAVLGAATQKG